MERDTSSLSRWHNRVTPNNTVSNRSATHPHLPATLILPHVRISPHPFYKLMEDGVLMRPSAMRNNNFSMEGNFEFSLTTDQADLIFENFVQRRRKNVQVVVRFCKSDSTDVQDDSLPRHLSVQCNRIPVRLPEADIYGRRPNRPINITPQLHGYSTSPNTISVSWYPQQPHALGVYLVKRLSPKAVIKKLERNATKPVEFTKQLVREQFTSSDDEIVTSKIAISLKCPVGLMRIHTPLRGERCKHVQCFDASWYFVLNYRRPTWRCPVCDEPTKFEDLYIDGLFREILRDSDSTSEEIEFNSDGEWTVVREDEEEDLVDRRCGKRKRESSSSRRVSIDSSDEETEAGTSARGSRN